MLTPFGRYCRKIRIDSGELLKDMANNLGVTPSYLSAVEIGKRNVPEKWIETISKTYSLSKKQKQELVKACEQSVCNVKIKLNGLADTDRETVLAFARDFGDLGEEEKKKIRAIFNKGR